MDPCAGKVPMSEEDEVEEMTEEEYQEYLALVQQLLEVERLHAIFAETADNRRPPPFRPLKKTGWVLFRSRKGKQRDEKKKRAYTR